MPLPTKLTHPIHPSHPANSELLLDEAGPLDTTRTAVRDSHDRFAEDPAPNPRDPVPSKRRSSPPGGD